MELIPNLLNLNYIRDENLPLLSFTLIFTSTQVNLLFFQINQLIIIKLIIYDA